MPLFISSREIDLFTNLNEEIIQTIIGQFVDYYSIDPETSAPDNLYGESIEKTFKKPVRVYCLVQYDEPTSVTVEEGVDVSYGIEIKFLRSMLKSINLYPREGDIVKFGDKYYEIGSVLEVKLITGIPGWEWDILCKCNSTRENQINLEDSHI